MAVDNNTYRGLNRHKSVKYSTQTTFNISINKIRPGEMVFVFCYSVGKNACLNSLAL